MRLLLRGQWLPRFALVTRGGTWAAARVGRESDTALRRNRRRRVVPRRRPGFAHGAGAALNHAFAAWLNGAVTFREEDANGRPIIRGQRVPVPQPAATAAFTAAAHVAAAAAASTAITAASFLSSSRAIG